MTYGSEKVSPDCKIEITPAMIRAGVDALISLDLEFDPLPRVVLEVLQAALAAHHESERA
jgi:hypothetical protein